MALRYSGGMTDEFQGTVFIFGDGTSKTIAINVKVSPFNLNFGSTPPTDVVLINRSENLGVTLQFNSSTSTLSITFDDPPPAVDFNLPGPRFGGRELTIGFVYG